MRAAYDAYADWYEDYVTGDAAEFTARVASLVRRLLGPGTGQVLDLCCGTGAHAGLLRELGWAPVGVDLSLGQLRYAAARLPVAGGDGAALPVASGRLPAVAALVCHTDLPDYPAVVREAARALRPGGRFVHVGIHPCFCGGFADRNDVARVVVDASYDRRERRFDGFHPEGVRARLGAWHTPLPDLLRAAVDAGLVLTDFAEAGPSGGVPDIFGYAATRST